MQESGIFGAEVEQHGVKGRCLFDPPMQRHNVESYVIPLPSVLLKPKSAREQSTPDLSYLTASEAAQVRSFADWLQQQTAGIADPWVHAIAAAGVPERIERFAHDLRRLRR